LDWNGVLEHRPRIDERVTLLTLAARIKTLGQSRQQSLIDSPLANSCGKILQSTGEPRQQTGVK